MTAVSQARRVQVKIFFDGPQPPALEPFIPVFHGWIQQHRLPELLVDVADYIHVPKGPGVGLVGHQSDYFIDQGEGQSGLLYTRKRDPDGDGLEHAFRRALYAAGLLEQEEAFAARLRFRTDEMVFRVADRLLAPSSGATFAAFRPELDSFCSRLFGANGYQLALRSAPRQVFAVGIGVKEPAPVASLLERLGGPPQ